MKTPSWFARLAFAASVLASSPRQRWPPGCFPRAVPRPLGSTCRPHPNCWRSWPTAPSTAPRRPRRSLGRDARGRSAGPSPRHNRHRQPCRPGPSAERINILCLGLDNLDPKAAYRRSDTIIVVSIDPVAGTVGMLSIPRDLYVTINGLTPPQKNRINAAYVFGDYYEYPGGGIALARRTVQETLGIPIHNYVAVDFQGFIKAVDAIGGVDITLDKALSDPYLTQWSFPAGPQHLNGEQALRFARIRYMDNDLQRERRQQKLLLALREQALRVDILPRLPALLASLSGSFSTDLSVTDILSLAPLAAGIDPSRIQNRIFDETMVTSYRTSAGAMVLLPNEAAIASWWPRSWEGRPSRPRASPTAGRGSRRREATRSRARRPASRS